MFPNDIAIQWNPVETAIWISCFALPILYVKKLRQEGYISPWDRKYFDMTHRMAWIPKLPKDVNDKLEKEQQEAFQARIQQLIAEAQKGP